MARLVVADPRDPAGEAELPVCFQVTNPGHEPHGHGRDFDPGWPPEIVLRFALDERHVDVLPEMTREECDAIETEILERFDFGSRAARD